MSLLPVGYLNAVVSIERESSNDYVTTGTGFLIGLAQSIQDVNGDDKLHMFLVTNKHIVVNQTKIHLRFNKGDGQKRYELQLLDGDNRLWFYHERDDVDIAIIPLDAEQLHNDNIIFSVITKDCIATYQEMKSFGISSGDEIFVLGFPIGIFGKNKKYVIVRGGVIARLDDEIINDESCFLIDSTLFPGNSGGPICLKPSNDSLVGREPITRAFVLGVVRSYIPYQDVAYTMNTNPPTARVIFSENSGLAHVIPFDYVFEITNRLMRI